MEVGYTAPPVTLGHEDEAKTLLNRLVGGPRQLGIVPIVGMPGLGKTTLATRLYSHQTVMGHYDVRSWCCISQVYDRKDVLLEILRGLGTKNTAIKEIDDHGSKLADELAKKESDQSELADELRKFLKGKRYLVILDDLWSTDAWDDFRTIFPDDNKGSRLVLTTRLDEVAFYASTNPHHLRILTEEESSELLKKIVFGEESCPSELEDIGNEIARSCSGLPLAVVLTGGLLARGEKEVDYWKEVSQNLSSTLFHDAKWLMDVTELSYKTLPHDLKPCFLYFGAFSEDDQISVQRLIQLWICEGFIPHNNDLEGLEHVATNYLMDLVGRNLVMVAKRTYSGKAKFVRVHDMLHQFCIKKAEEIHLLRFYGSEISDYDHPQLETALPSRLVVPSVNYDFMKWSSPCESSRSLRFTVSASIYTTPSLDDSLEALRLLTVLDLGKIYLESFPDGILLLIHLRYLEINGCLIEVPSTISFLANLEILIFGSTVRTNLPETIWDLVKLRRLQVPGRFPFSRFNPHEISPLEKLETCFDLGICLPRDMPVIVHGLSNVVNLKCKITDEAYDSEDDNYDEAYDPDDSRFCEPAFRTLHQLKSLFLECDPAYPPARRVFEFPSSIKILELLSFTFCDPLRSVSSIGELPNLEVLRLSKCWFLSPWDVNDCDFPKLKVLRLSDFDCEWNVSDDAFPAVQQLLLRDCEELDIPSSFGYSCSLKLLEVLKCGTYTVQSAMKIKEIQVDEMAKSDFRLVSDHSSKEEKDS